MVIVDKLSKLNHFIPVKYNYNDVNITHIFLKDIFRLHGVPKVIISDRDAKFIENFLKDLFKGLGTELNFIIVYHP